MVIKKGHLKKTVSAFFIKKDAFEFCGMFVFGDTRYENLRIGWGGVNSPFYCCKMKQFTCIYMYGRVG